MDYDWMSADAGFCRAMLLIRKAVETENRARREAGCGGLLKMAAKHRADAHVLIMDGLIETAQPWG